jgi:hypothetical protein
VEPLTRGLPPPDPRSVCPLSSTEFVNPPEKIPGYATGDWCVTDLCRKRYKMYSKNLLEKVLSTDGMIVRVLRWVLDKVWRVLDSSASWRGPVNLCCGWGRGFKPGWSPLIFRAKKSSAQLPSEGKYSGRPHVAALRHVKNPYNYRRSRNCKLNSIGHFSPTVLFFSRDAWRRQVRL